MVVEILRKLEDNLRDQSAYARQRNLDDPVKGEISGEVLYGLSQALVITRVQLEREAESRRKWYKLWLWT